MFRYFLGKKFEGNGTGKFQILSSVHHPHPSPSQDFQNAIMRKPFAGNFAICRKGRCSLRIFYFWDVPCALQPFDGNDEPVSSAREGLNILGILSTVADGLA